MVDLVSIVLEKMVQSWFSFFAITFLPVTLFYFILLFAVSINVLSPYLNAFVLFAQLLTVPGNLFFTRLIVSQVVDVDVDKEMFFRILRSNVLHLRHLELRLP